MKITMQELYGEFKGFKVHIENIFKEIQEVKEDIKDIKVGVRQDIESLRVVVKENTSFIDKQKSLNWILSILCLAAIGTVLGIKFL